MARYDAALAAVALTLASAGPISAQDSFTLSGDVTFAETEAREPRLDINVFEATDIYRIVVTDRTALSYSALRSRGTPRGSTNEAARRLWLHFFAPAAAEDGILDSRFSGAVADREVIARQGIEEGESSTIEVLSGVEDFVDAGQYLMVVALHGYDVEGSYEFTLTGATLGWGPSAEELAAAEAQRRAEELAAAEAARAAEDLAAEAARAAIRTASDLAAADAERAATRTAALSQATVFLSRGIVSQAGGVAAAQANRGRAGGATRTTASSRGETRRPVHTWIEFTRFAADGDDLRQHATGFQLGGDVHVTPQLALGLSIGHNRVGSSLAGFDLSGDLTFVQPYAAFARGPMRGEVSLIYGRGAFDQTSADGNGSSRIRLMAATLSGAYDISMKGGWTVSPMVSLSHGAQESRGTGGTLAGADTKRTTFGRASVGTRLTMPLETGTVFAGLHADYDYGNGDSEPIAGFVDDTGPSGRVELGISTIITDRLDLRASVTTGGLGTRRRDTTASLRFGITF